jgi:hypothetical protein
MPIETATYIGDLVPTNPTGTDPKSQGDDHLRLLKAILQATFAGFAGPVLAVGVEAQGATVNDYVVTVSPAPAAWVNRMLVLFKATHANTGAATVKVNGLAATPIVGIDQAAIAAGDIEVGGWVLVAYDSAAGSAVLVSGNDRVSRNGDTIAGTLAIVGALNVSGAATLATLAVSGTATGTTPTTGDATTRLATTEFVRNTSFTTNLPGQLNNAGKELVTDGTNASWEPRFHLPVLALGIV